jgi:hypothetical protein
LRSAVKRILTWHDQYQSCPAGKPLGTLLSDTPKSIPALPLVRLVAGTNSTELIADILGGKPVGDVTMRRSIGDYHSLLSGAVSALESDDAEAREELYERARAALTTTFDKLDPPPSDMEIFEERLKLNIAIQDLEWFDCR